MKTKVKVFLDASVIFAGSLSTTGASHEIIRRIIFNELTGVISDVVLEEARRNLTLKMPHGLAAFEQLMNPMFFETAEPDQEAVARAQAYTVAKDAAIVAAAKLAEVDYLVTLDKKHLSEAPEVAQQSGLNIVSPGDFMKMIREREAG